MQVTSILVKIKNIKPITSNYIEKELEKMNIVPLRYAIVKMDDNNLLINCANFLK